MYATLADILEQAAESVLIDLTDDAGTGVIDQDKVDRAIVNASAVIDDFCRDRYPGQIPFNPVPDSVRMRAVDLAIFNLYSRAAHVEMPETVATRQKQALDYLRLVQKGEAYLGAAPKATAGTESHGALVSGNARIFTRDKTRGL